MPTISVSDPINPALDCIGSIFFRPFRFKKWLAVAVGAALIFVGEGMSPIFNLAPQVVHIPGFRIPGFDECLNWINVHLRDILMWSFFLVVILSILYLLGRWLSSRGHFIFYDNIVTNTDRVKEPWREFRELAYSLFKFRIAWDLAWFNVYLVLFVIAGACAWGDIWHWMIQREYPFGGGSIAAAIVLMIGLPAAALAWWLASALFFDLALPVMYIRRINAKPAIRLVWREIFRPHPGACLLYFLLLILVRWVQGMWGGIAMIVLAVLTLCIAYVALLIPFLGNYPLALAMLPPLAFERAYQLRFIGQFGPEYQVAWQTPVRGGFPVILTDTTPPPPPSGV
jgi:hypothetical protein